MGHSSFFEYGDINHDLGIRYAAEKGPNPNHYSSYPGQSRELNHITDSGNNLITDDEEGSSTHPTLTGGRVVISHYQGIPMKKDRKNLVKKVVKKSSRPSSKPSAK